MHLCRRRIALAGRVLIDRARGAFLPPIAFFARPRRGQPAGLLIRAGFPKSTFDAFRVALEVSHETGFIGTLSGAARCAAAWSIAC
jgi:hypothetical protein